MPSERARRGRHILQELGAAQRRHWIAALARTFERVAVRIDRPADVARLSGYADFMLDAVVVRLELVETERPILDGRSRGNPRRTVSTLRLAHHLEIPRVQPPALRPVMQRRTADRVLHRMQRWPR